MTEEIPRLSYSIAKVLLNRSVKHAWQAHRLLGGGDGQESSAEMELGSMVEALMGLGEVDRLVMVDAEDWRTKEAKAQRDAIRAQGKIAVLAKKYGEAFTIAEQLKLSLAAKGISLDGEQQKRLEWNSPNPFNPVSLGVACSGVADLIRFTDGWAEVLDLKITDNASPAAFARNAINLGYDVQAAAYIEAVNILFPDFAGRVKYKILACEPYAPFVVQPYELDGGMLELGARKWSRAVAAWGKALAWKKWPDYGPNTMRLEAPMWAVSNEMAEGLTEEGSEA